MIQFLIVLATLQNIVVVNVPIVYADITAYTCSDAPCINAAGHRATWGTVACPRAIPLGTRVQIGDVGTFTCADRTNKKYDGRYDIFTTDERSARIWGIQKLPIIVY